MTDARWPFVLAGWGIGVLVGLGILALVSIWATEIRPIAAALFGGICAVIGMDVGAHIHHLVKKCR